MNKFLFLLLFIAISLGYMFKLDLLIAKNFNVFNNIKELYINTALSIEQTIEKYFYHITQIETLKKENDQLKNYKLKYFTEKHTLNSLLNALDTPNSITKTIKFTRVLSYIKFDDFTEVWLDIEKKDDSILGIISKEYAAGIVVNDNNKAKALLNGNEKCNYAIFIGDKKAPGIIHATKNKKNLIAKFIPIWFDISIGDEVVTSGMDNIFFEGLKVGKVIDIKKKQDIQEATIKPYAKVLKQNAFFVYKKSFQTKNKKIMSTELN